MALSNKAVAKLEKSNDSLKGRMKRKKEADSRMMSRISGSTGRAAGAFLGGKFLADKDVKGVNVGWGIGLVGLGIQYASDGAGGQLIGGLMEGPMNGLLYKKGEES